MAHPQPFALAPSAASGGFTLRVSDTVGSTNDMALAAAHTGDSGRCWFVAHAQTAGRGRHRRTWMSPLGNLYASLLLVDATPIGAAPQLGFVAGVALARALRALVAEPARLKLKWPNDVLFDGAKLAGILLECIRVRSGGFASVIGIGVNCISYPCDLLHPATALSEAGATVANPQEVFLRLSGEMAHWLDTFRAGSGFAAIRGEWLALAGGLGEPIKVATPGQQYEGRFATIDANGRLLLQSETGVVAIDAGDVVMSR